jgi:hypothetical protein
MLHSPATVIQHLLFFFLLVAAPAWDYYDTSQLRKNPGSPQKIRYYKTLCAWLWMATLVAFLATEWRPLLTIYPAPGEIPWLLKHAWVFYLVEAVIAVFIALVLLPVVIVIRKKNAEAAARVFLGRRPAIAQLLPACNRDGAPMVGVALHHGRHLRRSSLSRLSAALPACLSRGAESHNGDADRCGYLWTATSLPGCCGSGINRSSRADFQLAVRADGKPFASHDSARNPGPANAGDPASSGGH